MLKDTQQIVPKKFLLLVKLKMQFHGHMLLMTSMMKKFIGRFYEKKLQKTNQKEFRIKKVIKEKVINYMSVHLIAGLIKKI